MRLKKVKDIREICFVTKVLMHCVLYTGRKFLVYGRNNFCERGIIKKASLVLGKTIFIFVVV